MDEDTQQQTGFEGEGGQETPPDVQPDAEAAPADTVEDGPIEDASVEGGIVETGAVETAPGETAAVEADGGAAAPTEADPVEEALHPEAVTPSLGDAVWAWLDTAHNVGVQMPEDASADDDPAAGEAAVALPATQVSEATEESQTGTPAAKAPVRRRRAKKVAQAVVPTLDVDVVPAAEAPGLPKRRRAKKAAGSAPAAKRVAPASAVDISAQNTGDESPVVQAVAIQADATQADATQADPIRTDSVSASAAATAPGEALDVEASSVVTAELEAPAAGVAAEPVLEAPEDDIAAADASETPVVRSAEGDVSPASDTEAAAQTAVRPTSEIPAGWPSGERPVESEPARVAAPVAPMAVLFQPPVARRRRAASRPAGPPQPRLDEASSRTTADVSAEPVSAPEPLPASARPEAPVTPESDTANRKPFGGLAASATDTDTADNDTAGNGQPGAIDQGSNDTAADTGSSDSDTDKTGGEPASTDDSTDDGPRRRRRRGGRGRRRRGDEETESSPAEEVESADTDATAEPSEPADDLDDAKAEDEPAGADAEGDEESSGSRRRRRRRRRATGGSEEPASQDDPPNTVVRVRQGRRGQAPNDEVTGVKGSTRLEAKRQRRREGRESGRRRQIITEAEFLARRESVERTMLVRESAGRTQLVVLEDGVLVEHYVARKQASSMIGNIYLGRVQNVLPSMEAAFIDIGKGRNAVLYAGEVNWDAAGLQGGQARRIELALKSGDSVLVQASKDPIGHKGARLTSQISLPGRYLVYVPGASLTGISRKLPDTERSRLKKILRQVVPEDAGVIVRTAAEGASEEELKHDVERLQRQWAEVEKKAKSANPPTMVHGEPDLMIKVIRDVFNEDFKRLVVDGDEAWKTVKDYVDQVAPDLSERVAQWDGEGDLFTAHRVDEQIAKGLERKVWLPSGGSLVIDRTEAMTVVDVNTGKFVGSGGNLEETVTRNNLEAAEEIVRQLRLRDIGGIIVIDFIDMVLESNRDLVLRRLVECLGRDRTKHQVAEVTSLGLVQMTRKRMGEGLLEAFSVPCEHCGGRGVTIVDLPGETRSQAAIGNGGGANLNQSASSKPEPARRHLEAQRVAEAARKAKERASAATEENLASGADAPAESAPQVDVEALGAESEAQPQPHG